MKTLFFIICLVAGAYRLHEYIQERRVAADYAAFEASEPGSRPASRGGFKEILPLDGVDPLVVTVLMPCGCPLEAGQRGRALVAKIKAADIPVASTDHVRMSIKAQSREELSAKMALMNSVMNGETPIVVYKGRAKNNPSFADVLAEYQASR
jgi:hypothetical protein